MGDGGTVFGFGEFLRFRLAQLLIGRGRLPVALGKEGVGIQKMLVFGLRGRRGSLGFQWNQTSWNRRDKLNEALALLESTLPTGFIEPGKVFVRFEERRTGLYEALEGFGEVLELGLHGLEG